MDVENLQRSNLKQLTSASLKWLELGFRNGETMYFFLLKNSDYMYQKIKKNSNSTTPLDRNLKNAAVISEYCLRS